MKQASVTSLQRLTESLAHPQALADLAQSAFRHSLVVIARPAHRRNGMKLEKATSPIGISYLGFLAGQVSYRIPSAMKGMRYCRAIKTHHVEAIRTRFPQTLVNPRPSLVGKWSDHASAAQHGAGTSWPRISRLSPLLTLRSSAISPMWVGRRPSRSARPQSVGQPPYRRPPPSIRASTDTLNPRHLRMMRSRTEIRTASFVPTAASSQPSPSYSAGTAMEDIRDEPSRQNEQALGTPPAMEGHFGGADLGHWMMDYLERQLLRLPVGMTGVDPRVTPL